MSRELQVTSKWTGKTGNKDYTFYDAVPPNQIAMITGGNAGLGKGIALELAKKQYHVIIACRSADKGEVAVREIKAAVPGANVECIGGLELSNLDSVRTFAAAFIARGTPLQLLVNNAGIMGMNEKTLTKDMWEMHFAVNHLGPFLLTNLLLPVLRTSVPSRVITVSSMGHRDATIDLDDLHFERRKYKWYPAYGQSKLANALFMYELNERMAGNGVSACCCDPGMVKTDLLREKRGGAFLRWIQSKMGAPLDFGARSAVFAATYHDGIGSKYFFNGELHKCAKCDTGDAQVKQTSKQLWEISSRLVGL